jgi:hypothetical protein
MEFKDHAVENADEESDLEVMRGNRTRAYMTATRCVAQVFWGLHGITLDKICGDIPQGALSVGELWGLIQIGQLGAEIADGKTPTAFKGVDETRLNIDCATPGLMTQRLQLSDHDTEELVAWVTAHWDAIEDVAGVLMDRSIPSADLTSEIQRRILPAYMLEHTEYAERLVAIEKEKPQK